MRSYCLTEKAQDSSLLPRLVSAFEYVVRVSLEILNSLLSFKASQEIGAFFPRCLNLCTSKL